MLPLVKEPIKAPVISSMAVTMCDGVAGSFFRQAISLDENIQGNARHDRSTGLFAQTDFVVTLDLTRCASVN